MVRRPTAPAVTFLRLRFFMVRDDAHTCDEGSCGLGDAIWRLRHAEKGFDPLR